MKQPKKPRITRWIMAAVMATGLGSGLMINPGPLTPTPDAGPVSSGQIDHGVQAGIPGTQSYYDLGYSAPKNTLPSPAETTAAIAPARKVYQTYYLTPRPDRDESIPNKIIIPLNMSEEFNDAATTDGQDAPAPASPSTPTDKGPAL